MNEETRIARQMLLPLAILTVILGTIAYGMHRVEGWGSALPPTVLAVACGLLFLVLWLGTRRTLAVIVISVTALVGGAISYEADTSEPAAAHTWSCNYNTSTYLGKVQQATCILNLQAHLLNYMARLNDWNQCMVIRSMGYNVSCGPRPTH